MCVFCVAIPSVAVTGASLNSKQINEIKEAERKGIQPRSRKPIAQITAVAIILIIACSVLYHMLIPPNWRI
jgi:uncharacterized membrane protein YvbJ